MSATKLYAPPPRPGAVARPRLLARLSAGLHRRLTLVSAPAGFGKSALLGAWLAACGRPAAWLSLDPADNDPARLLAALVAALRTLAPAAGAEALAALQSPQPPPVEALLPPLLNELAALPRPALLVIDDCHLLAAAPAARALAALVEQLPPALHLVLATREDPALPLARLRARDQLSELRAPDLRFTPDEAAAFLSDTMGLRLAADELAALERRTEGWAAGLQLAALSLQGQPDPAGFIRSFTGGHHFVLDYLVEEVLSRQGAAVQGFLLRTSVLERLCGPLCDAVLRDPEAPGQATLERLERANLFLVPLDGERRWYRYHHLFAEALAQRLGRAAAPGEVAALHARASAWHEEQGLELEAFQHAAHAGDAARAERLIGGRGMPLHYRGALAPVLRWLESLPPAALDARPSLWVLFASAVTMAGRPAGDVEQKLRAAEAALRRAEPGEESRDLLGQIAATCAMAAIPQGQVEAMAAESRRALELLRPDNLSARAGATWTLGLAHQLRGERAAAAAAYAEAIASGRASGNRMIVIGATTCLGQVQEAELQHALAADSYRRVLELAGDPPLPAACEAHLGLARVLYEWDDLGGAERHAHEAARLARQIETTDTPASCWLLLARVRLAQGDPAGAAALLARAEQFVRRLRFAHRAPEVAEAQVAALLRRGDLAAAARLAHAHALPLGRARVCLAQGEPAAALALLEPLRREAAARGLADAELRALVLLAVAREAQGAGDEAARLLAEALALAAPGGLVRTFVDEGEPMARLLAGAQVGGAAAREQVAALRAAFGPRADAQATAARPQALAEPLSQRELDVLRLVSEGLSNREIGERLVLALDTVKGHNRRIYDKLQVQRRTEAVARARELGLL